jgi:hypothetical protein
MPRKKNELTETGFKKVRQRRETESTSKNRGILKSDKERIKPRIKRTKGGRVCSRRVENASEGNWIKLEGRDWANKSRKFFLDVKSGQREGMDGDRSGRGYRRIRKRRKG